MTYTYYRPIGGAYANQHGCCEEYTLRLRPINTLTTRPVLGVFVFQMSESLLRFLRKQNRSCDTSSPRAGKMVMNVKMYRIIN